MHRICILNLATVLPTVSMWFLVTIFCLPSIQATSFVPPQYHHFILSRKDYYSIIFYSWFLMNSIQSVSQFSRLVVSNSANPWTAAHQASLSITNSRSLLKLMSIELVMPSNHLILCRPLLLLPQIPPRIRVFSNESTLLMRWPKYWSFRFSISPSNELPGLISFRMDQLDLLAVQGTQESSPTPHFKSINFSALSFLHSPTLISNMTTGKP